jgi:hypothetical protein
VSSGGEEVSGGGEEGTEKEFDRRWRGRGEELNEAAVMSSTGARRERARRERRGGARG